MNKDNHLHLVNFFFRINSASTNGADIEDEVEENNDEGQRPLAAKKRSVRISDEVDILSNGDGSPVSDSFRKGNT